MKCPNCGIGSWNGISRCECGYDPASATRGRPMIDETLELPSAPKGAAVMMIVVGVILCLVGAYLAYSAYTSAAPLPVYDWKYVVGFCAVGVGILRVRKGLSLSPD